MPSPAPCTPLPYRWISMFGTASNSIAAYHWFAQIAWIRSPVPACRPPRPRVNCTACRQMSVARHMQIQQVTASASDWLSGCCSTSTVDCVSVLQWRHICMEYYGVVGVRTEARKLGGTSSGISGGGRGSSERERGLIPCRRDAPATATTTTTTNVQYSQPVVNIVHVLNVMCNGATQVRDRLTSWQIGDVPVSPVSPVV
jgi:hypothetical protein